MAIQPPREAILTPHEIKTVTTLATRLRKLLEKSPYGEEIAHNKKATESLTGLQDELRQWDFS